MDTLKGRQRNKLENELEVGVTFYKFHDVQRILKLQDLNLTFLFIIIC